jgi:hypothetical protein
MTRLTIQSRSSRCVTPTYRPVAFAVVAIFLRFSVGTALIVAANTVLSKALQTDLPLIRLKTSPALLPAAIKALNLFLQMRAKVR